MLELDFLGGFRLAFDGVPIERPVRPRLQALLALLVIHAGRAFGREQLAGMLWPESSTRGSQGNLRRLLFDLRQEVPAAAGLVQTSAGSLRWPETGAWRSDVWEFQRQARAEGGEAQAAIAFYRGDLLPGSYDTWLAAEREHLRGLFVHSLERGIAAAEAAGERARAIDYARRLLAEEPLREDIYRSLMRLYRDAGDVAGALRIYLLCTSTLERELGIEPSRATLELYESLAGREAAPVVPAGPVRLVGRGEEWQVLQRAWKQAAAGGSQLVLIQGEPGIGKSRLLAELGSWAAREGARTLRARAYDTRSTPAFAPVAALLRSAPLPELAPVWLTELARLLPEVAASHPDLPAPQPLTEAWQRTRLFEALARGTLPGGPVLLLLDDLQWFDAESLDWLSFLLSYAPEARLLVVATSRPEGAEGWEQGAPFLEGLRRDGRLETIELPPLDRTDTLELAAAHGAALDDEGAGRLWEETGGNPLFVIEVLRAGSTEAGRATIGSLLRDRFLRLSPSTRQVAGIAGLLGRAFTVPELVVAVQERDSDLVAALDELWRLRLIRESVGNTYDFAHDRVRQAAGAALSPAARRLLHGRIARALERVHAGELDERAGELAAHFEAAGDTATGSRYHLRAGDAARRVYANTLAAAHFRRAAEGLPAGEQLPVLLRLGAILTQTGEMMEAEQILHRAIAEADRVGDKRLGAEGRYWLTTALYTRSAYDEGDPWLDAAISAFDELGDPVWLSWSLSLRSGAHAFRGDHAAARAALAEAERLASVAGDTRARMNNFSKLYLSAFFQSEFDEAEVYELRHEALAEAIGDERHLAMARSNLALVHQEQGEYARAIAEFLDSAERFEAIGDSALTAITLSNLSLAYKKVGAFPEALRILERAADLGRRTGVPLVEYCSLAQMGTIFAFQGRLTEAESVLPRAAEWLATHSLPFQASEALYFLADLRQRQGRPREALEAAAAARQMAEGIRMNDYALLARLLQIRVELELGQRAREDALAELASILALQSEPHRRALLHYSLWQIDPTREGDREAASTLYREVYGSRPNVFYRHRYREMTGEDLPPPY